MELLFSPPLLWVVLAAAALFFLALAFRPVRRLCLLFFNGAAGSLVLLGLNVFGVCTVGVNGFTFACCALLGLPGAGLVLLLRWLLPVSGAM